jgi:hypothetical protein
MTSFRSEVGETRSAGSRLSQKGTIGRNAELISGGRFAVWANPTRGILRRGMSLVGTAIKRRFCWLLLALVKKGGEGHVGGLVSQRTSPSGLRSRAALRFNTQGDGPITTTPTAGPPWHDGCPRFEQRD